MFRRKEKKEKPKKETVLAGGNSFRGKKTVTVAPRRKRGPSTGRFIGGKKPRVE